MAMTTPPNDIDETPDPNGFELQDDGAVTSASPDTSNTTDNPIVSDSELRRAIVNYRVRCDLFLGERDDDVYTQEEYEKSIQWALDDVMKLIETWADRRAEKLVVEAIDKAISDTQSDERYTHDREIEARINELEEMSLKVVEPCESDCDEVRHALHQGSWNAHLVIEARIAQLKAGEK